MDAAATKTGRSVEKSVRIRASADSVWAALTDPGKASRWLGGAEVDTSWEVGSSITFRSNLGGKVHEYGGTILSFESPKHFSYNLWSEIYRLPDKAETRSVVTITVESSDLETCVTVRHDNLLMEAGVEHSTFYWGVALHVLKGLAEGEAV